MVPGGSAGGGTDVLDVEDVVLEVFVEDAGLDFEGGLRGLELAFQLEQVAGGARGEVEGVEQAKAEGGEGEDGDDADKAEDPDAAGAHGCELAVGGEAAEAEQDSGEDGGGQGDGECAAAVDSATAIRVGKYGFSSRAEVVKDALRDFFKKYPEITLVIQEA